MKWLKKTGAGQNGGGLALNILLMAVLAGAASGWAEARSAASTVKPGATKPNTAKPSTAKPSVPQGKLIYEQNCAGCHGRQLEGGIAPSIRAAGQASPEQFKAALLRGKGLDGRTLRMTMPRFVTGFRPHVGQPPSDQELQSLRLFLKQAK